MTNKSTQEIYDSLEPSKLLQTRRMLRRIRHPIPLIYRADAAMVLRECRRELPVSKRVSIKDRNDAARMSMMMYIHQLAKAEGKV